LGGGIVVSLAESEDAPVGPARGLTRRELCEPGQRTIGVHIVPDLQSGQAYVKSGNSLRVLGRRFQRDFIARSTPRQKGGKH